MASLGAGLALVLRTWPFLLLRIAVFFGIAAAFVVAVRGGGELGWAMGAVAGPEGRPPGAFWGAIGGAVLIVSLLRWLREYLLYLLRAGHVAAMVLLLERRTPAPRGQVSEAIDLVQRRFRGMAALVAIERLVRGALAALPAAVAPGAKLPRDGSPTVSAALNLLLRPALGFMPDVVLARTLRAASANPWASARDALLFLAQNESLLRSALLLGLAAYAATLAIFLLALASAGSLAAAHPGDSAPVAILLAAIFAWSFKQAFIEPVMIAATVHALTHAERARPGPTWDEKLTAASEEFRELKARAASTRATRRADA
jgi:hypothetical protein